MSLNLQQDHPPIEGTWWLPHNPGVRWHGELSLQATKMASLKLIEYGKSFLQSDFNRLDAGQKIIHGITSDGKAVTLARCYVSQRNQSSGSHKILFDIQYALFGHHLNEADLVFDEVQIEFDYLDDWITHCRFEAKDMVDQEEQREIRIRLNQNHQFPFQTQDYAGGLFYVGYSASYTPFQFTIQSRSNLQITYPGALPLDDVLKDAAQWEWFFTLGTSRKTSLMSVSLYREDLSFTPGDKTFKKPYDLWLSTNGKRENKKTVHPSRMAFSFPDIQNDISKILSRWKAIQTPWAAVLHRYFASIHRDGIQLEEQFLFRAHALEAMARSQSQDNNIQLKAAYGAAWEKATPVLREKLGDKHAFVEAVRVNRNYLTHYNPSDEKKAFDFADLYDLSQKMGFLLESIILKEIGLSEKMVERAIGERRWGHLVQFDET